MRILFAGLFALLVSSTLVLMPAQAETLILDWEDLVPAKGKGEVLSIPGNAPTLGTPRREDYDGTDDEYEEMLEVYEAQRYMQPQGVSIRSDLNGKTVRIPGFITPLEIDGEKVVEFLLVPYVGACIHVPSPPGNQIIYISKIKGITLDNMYDPIWITGKLKAKPLATILADVGYHMENVKIEPYVE
ncbi:MAG: DUF3299 domain-containing protein [Rhizobiaceae bacterium]|nr:DUF3299 domain-containing protein [Rhizobiaceae bacterium]MBL4731244.1 DUF3299 domain-containing protein [Rhizobiaceae bacterium]